MLHLLLFFCCEFLYERGAIMPEEIPVELQEEFMDVVDSYVFKKLRSSKRKYERSERRVKNQLILNEPINADGEELVDYLVGSEDVECKWDFMNSIDNEKLFDALNSLSERERNLIKLRFYDDYSNDEISKMLGYKVKTVYEDISKIISKLRKSMV